MSSPVYTQGPDNLWRLQVDPTFVANTGSLATCNVQAFYQSTFTNNADPTDYFNQQQGSVNIDCVTNSDKTVTFPYGGGSQTMSYGLIAAGMAAAAAQEWNTPP